MSNPMHSSRYHTLRNTMNTLITRYVTMLKNHRKQLSIHPARTQEEVDAIRAMLTEHLPYQNFVARPQSIICETDRTSLPLSLVGVWQASDLIAAALIGGAEQEAQYVIRMGFNKEARLMRKRALTTHEICVKPTHRHTGVATALQHWIHDWGRQHGAHIALAIPMNQASRSLYKKTGYTITEPNTTLIARYVTTGETIGYPTIDNMTWAIRYLKPAHLSAIRITISQPQTRTNTITHMNSTHKKSHPTHANKM